MQENLQEISRYVICNAPYYKGRTIKMTFPFKFVSIFRYHNYIEICLGFLDVSRNFKFRHFKSLEAIRNLKQHIYSNAFSANICEG